MRSADSDGAISLKAKLTTAHKPASLGSATACRENSAAGRRMIGTVKPALAPAMGAAVAIAGMMRLAARVFTYVQNCTRNTAQLPHQSQKLRRGRLRAGTYL
jgi:hypothetical protein